MTGYGTIKNAIELVRLGACGYLTKPFNISEFTNEIVQAIEKNRVSLVFDELKRRDNSPFS